MTNLQALKKYFSLPELFSAPVVAKYGEMAWSFLDPRLVATLVWLREGLGVPLVINTADKQQRGFRENTCQIVRERTEAGKMYCSAHTLGKGVDVNAAKNRLSAEQIRAWIRKNIDTAPYPIRIERTEGGKPISWCHLDTMVPDDSINRLIEFDA